VANFLDHPVNQQSQRNRNIKNVITIISLTISILTNDILQTKAKMRTIQIRFGDNTQLLNKN